MTPVVEAGASDVDVVDIVPGGANKDNLFDRDGKALSDVVSIVFVLEGGLRHDMHILDQGARKEFFPNSR